MGAEADWASLNRLCSTGSAGTATCSPSPPGNNQPVPLSAAAPGMLRRIGGVQRVSAVQYVSGRIARRTALVDVQNTNGLSVQSADPSLAETLSLRLASGRFLDPATARFPAAVLGSFAAAALGVADAGPSALVDLTDSASDGGGYFAVLGVLAPAPSPPSWTPLSSSDSPSPRRCCPPGPRRPESTYAPRRTR